jgi:enoyl-CoA hydratase/carnithine racemase
VVGLFPQVVEPRDSSATLALMANFVRLDVSSGVATLRLDRPPMNALDAAMQEEIRAAAAEATARDDVRAVVVYGGEKVFAAGADIKEMAAMSYADMLARSTGLQSAFTSVAQIPKPVVAAVTGYALGGGCELALCADVRFCADNAKLGQPEILLGVIPGAGGTQRLARLVGPSRAKDMIFTGRFVAADEALSIGLVDRVMAPDEVYPAAVEWAATLAKGPRFALRAAKSAIDHGLEVNLAAGLEIERQHFAGLFATSDRLAGMESFIASGPGKAEFEDPAR